LSSTAEIGVAQGRLSNGLRQWLPDMRVKSAERIRASMTMGDSQLYLVGLATDVTRTLGRSMQMECISWLADDSGLLFAIPGPHSTSKKEGSIARINLGGGFRG
jgi:hypothetical protein